MFQSSLGYNLSNYKNLINEIDKGIRENEAIEQKDKGFGQRYKVDIPITGPNGNTRTVTTAWIKDEKTNQIKLTTVFVKSLNGDEKDE